MSSRGEYQRLARGVQPLVTKALLLRRLPCCVPLRHLKASKATMLLRRAWHPMATKDSTGAPLDGHSHNYTLTFQRWAGRYPPVNAFLDPVTMYDGKTELLIENPINRYFINFTMLLSLKKNKDGSLTMYIQEEPSRQQPTRIRTGYPHPTDQFTL